MPRLRRPSLALAVALIAFALAGCGDDEGSETPATTTTSGATGAGGGDAEAEDAQAKSDARSAQVALETYATDNAGSYEGASPNNLDQISPVTADVGVKTTADSYEITVPSSSGNSFTIERASDDSTTKTCTEAGVGGCPQNGEW